MAISFFTEDIALPPIKKKINSKWVLQVANRYGKKIGDISYIFCSEEKILNINKQYLNHNYYTDIITFDYSENSTISGDLFISPDTIKSNAELLGEDYNIELHRVIIHGILHLCGIKDKDCRIIMEKSENDALDILGKEAYTK
jgi:rRNA maturation RNase YbeY